MPFWAARTLVVVLFFAVMAGVSAVLKAILPTALAPIDSTIGEAGTLILILAIGVACGVYGFWPRDAAGRMRPLLPRRR